MNFFQFIAEVFICCSLIARLGRFALLTPIHIKCDPPSFAPLKYPSVTPHALPPFRYSVSARATSSERVMCSSIARCWTASQSDCGRRIVALASASLIFFFSAIAHPLCPPDRKGDILASWRQAVCASDILLDPQMFRLQRFMETSGRAQSLVPLTSDRKSTRL